MHNLHLKPVNALSDYVTLCDYQGIPVVHVKHPLAEAAISLHGGHLFGFKPADQQDVIWLSKEAIFSEEKAIRGGIPVCWPWFGGAGTPSHGFARNSRWQLQEHRENDQGVIVALRLEHSPETLALWPNQFSLQILFEIGAELKVTLNTTNTDNKPWSFGGALHTYFGVEAIETTAITQMGSHFIDSVAGQTFDNGPETLTFDGETDRIYTQPEQTITIADGKRYIDVTNAGHNSAVIWNPGQALSTAMGDMANDSFETMVCVESTIQGDLVELQPGETHALSTLVTTR